MTPAELRAIMEFLRGRVLLASERPPRITFQAPTVDEMRQAGLNAAGTRRILAVPWWNEMTEDIVETPDMCDPEDSPQQILEYARDVISEYIRKRFPLQEGSH